MTLKVRILHILTTFTQVTARLKNFLVGWLLVLGLKEGLVECATVCVKSWVILACLGPSINDVTKKIRVFDPFLYYCFYSIFDYPSRILTSFTDGPYHPSCFDKQKIRVYFYIDMSGFFSIFKRQLIV